MTSQEPKGEEIILSKGDKTYKFLFQIISKDEMLIKAQQQKEKDEIIPYTYQKLLTIDHLPKKKGITITDISVVLDQIKLSSKNNTLDFYLEEKKNIKLHFYYSKDKDKEEIEIPFAYNIHDCNSIYTLSSMLSKSRKIFYKSFNRIKGLQININKLKNDENLFSNKVSYIVNDLKNYIKNINDQITSSKKSSDDFFNEIKTEHSSLSNKLDTSFQQQTTKNFSDLNTQIQNGFKAQKEEITQQKSTILDKLTPSTLKFRLR